jgi:hypothetical protein
VHRTLKAARTRLSASGDMRALADIRGDPIGCADEPKDDDEKAASSQVNKATRLEQERSWQTLILFERIDATSST